MIRRWPACAKMKLGWSSEVRSVRKPWRSLTSAQRRVTQAQANLKRLDNVLARFDVIAPLDGVVTDLPVRVGETVVQGVQNSAGSTIMTIADMSLITAEVDVDETDIVNVIWGKSAEVTIEAMPNQTFSGKVIQIGDTAIVRSSGLAASQSATSTQEAKDFKVVVALDNPPAEIRPGLSATAKITTATRRNVVAIPIQALTVRTKGDLEDAGQERRSEQASDPAGRKSAARRSPGRIRGRRATTPNSSRWTPASPEPPTSKC